MQYFLYRNGKKLGPYSRLVVERLLDDRLLTGQEQAWRLGLSNWHPLEQVLDDCFIEVAGASPSMSQDAGKPVEQGGARQTTYAGFWRRVLACLVDAVLLIVVLCVLGLVAGLAIFVLDGRSIEQLWWVYAAVGLIAIWSYFILFESSARQSTPGKMFVGIKVTNCQGQRISLLRAGIRHLGKLASFIPLCVGYLMAAWTSRKQCLHDKLAGTLVVREWQ